MNIFILDEDPIIAARMLCNRHVNKMILESAQMLSAVAYRYDWPTLYKPAYKNHPCTIWAGDSKSNWLWLIEHSIEMHAEKVRRTDRGHKSFDVIKFYYENDYGPTIDVGLTPFALAMPEEYRDEDPVRAYRSYYLGEKQFFKDGKRPKWQPSEPPDWWKYE